MLAATSTLPEEIAANLKLYQPKVSAEIAWGVTTILFVLAVANIVAALQGSISSSVPLAMIVFVPYIIFSIILHEGAHILALRGFGRRHDKVGFKLHYVILPAFYVRMSQSHLLDRYERLVVHAAGIVSNLALNLLLFTINDLWIRSANLSMALNFATVALIANALPFLNSDGYRVILALGDVPERRRFKENPQWIQVVKIVSGMLVVAYGWTMTYSIITEWIAK